MAAALEEVDADGVRALGELGAALLVAHRVESVVVHHELAVDVELGAVVGARLEVVVAAARHVDSAGEHDREGVADRHAGPVAALGAAAAHAKVDVAHGALHVEVVLHLVQVRHAAHATDLVQGR